MWLPLLQTRTLLNQPTRVRVKTQHRDAANIAVSLLLLFLIAKQKLYTSCNQAILLDYVKWDVLKLALAHRETLRGIVLYNLW